MKKTIITGLLFMIISISSCFANNAYINIDISRDTKLSDVLYAIGYRAGCNMVINAKLDTTVRGKMQGDFYDVLDYLATTNNFNYKVLENGTVLVSPADTMTETKSFNVNFANLEDAKKTLGLFIDAKKININPENSTIVIDGTQSQIAKAAKELVKMDTPTRQILLQVQMVEISKEKTEQLGLLYTMPSYSNTNFPINYQNISWAVSTEAKNIITHGNVLARPSMVTPNGRKAVVKMVDQVPILTVNISDSGNRQTQVDYKEVGVTFIGTPRINKEDDGSESVTMTVHPIISAITKWVTNGDTKAPQIASREAETIVRVKSGETIIIGGLMKEEEIDSIIKVPGLAELPILGGFFKFHDYSKNKGEVYIFVTPTILEQDGSVPSKLVTPNTPTTHIKNPNDPSLKQDEPLIKLDPQYNHSPIEKNVESISNEGVDSSTKEGVS